MAKTKQAVKTMDSNTFCLNAAGVASGTKKKDWSKPTLEDVSGKIMAQPYIRFT